MWKIWHYTALNPQRTGGVEKHIFNLSNELQKSGHEVHVGLNKPPFLPDFVHTHGDVVVTRRKMRRLLGSHSFYWIHVFHGTSLGRLKACGEWISASAWRGTSRELLIAWQADSAIAVSSHVRVEAEKYFHFKKPIVVIPNGVNTDAFCPLAKISSQPILGFVGRAQDRVKNVDRLFLAAQVVFRGNEKFELWMLPGCITSKKAPFIKNHNEFSDPFELSKKLGQCRALILPSLYEGDSLVLHEAKAMGLPILASRIAGNVSSLARYQNAFFFDPHSSEDMAQVITEMLNQTSLSPSPEIRSWSQVAQETLKIYSSLLDES